MAGHAVRSRCSGKHGQQLWSARPSRNSCHMQKSSVRQRWLCESSGELGSDVRASSTVLCRVGRHEHPTCSWQPPRQIQRCVGCAVAGGIGCSAAPSQAHLQKSVSANDS